MSAKGRSWWASLTEAEQADIAARNKRNKDADAMRVRHRAERRAKRQQMEAAGMTAEFIERAIALMERRHKAQQWAKRNGARSAHERLSR